MSVIFIQNNLNLTAGADQDVLADAIASAEAWGTPDILPGTATVLAAGIETAEAWGEPIIAFDQTVLAASIESAEVWGEPLAIQPSAQTVEAESIDSAEAWGLPTLEEVSELQAGWSRNLPFPFAFPQTVRAESIESEESWGRPFAVVGPAPQMLRPRPIVSREKWGELDATALESETELIVLALMAFDEDEVAA